MTDHENTRDYAYYFTMGELLNTCIVSCEFAMHSLKQEEMYGHLKFASRNLQEALRVFLDYQNGRLT